MSAPPDIPGFWEFAEDHRDAIAVIDHDGSTLTFGDAVDEVNRISRVIRARSTVEHPGVALFARNSANYLLTILAAYQCGCYITTINTHLTAHEVAHIVNDCDPVLLLVDTDTAKLAGDVVELTGLTAGDVFSLDRTGPFPSLAAHSQTHSATRLTDRRAGAPMLYTSGTSGQPKGVRPLLDSAAPAAPELVLTRLSRLLSRFDIDPVAEVGTGVHLATSPLYHSAPLNAALLAMHLGHRLVVMRRFDAERSLLLVAEHGVTWTQVVPTMMKRWLEIASAVRAAVDVSTLRWVIHAGAPCPVELKSRVIDWLGPIVYEYYASTEGGGTAITPQDWSTHPGSVGRPWTGADIMILDDAGRTVPAGEVGHIFMRNLRPFAYHHDQAKTVDAVRGDYVTVGDLGWKDDDGYLYIADRRADLILSGGVNVYPAEIEAVLLEHPAVHDAAVVGVQDDDLLQVPYAVIVANEGCNLLELETELHALCASRLGSQKRPRSIEFRSEIPRTETGKLRRHVLQNELWPSRADDTTSSPAAPASYEHHQSTADDPQELK